MNRLSRRAKRRATEEKLKRRALRLMLRDRGSDTERWLLHNYDNLHNCSCPMCGHLRKWHGPNPQELRILTDTLIAYHEDTPTQDKKVWKKISLCRKTKLRSQKVPPIKSLSYEEALARFSNIVGMTEEQARRFVEPQGYSLRVVIKDGEHFLKTIDVVPTRINISVSSGVISAIVNLG